MEVLALVAALAAILLVSGDRKRRQQMQVRLALLERRLAELEAARPSGEATASAAAAPLHSEAPPELTPEEQVDIPADAPMTDAPAMDAPPAAPSRRAARRGFEERFGTQWVVWVGGLALALGGIFLVRYSIEQGLIGPGVRVALGALLATALVAAGEWARRSEPRLGAVQFASAHVPAILTAAGTVVAFATVYAAHALYEFLPAVIAFVALGAVALACLAAALLHGPALAGLGLVGAYVTPLLVSSQEPSYPALYLYLIVVTAAAFALARARLWRWLAITAVVASASWTLPGLIDASGGATAAHALYLVVSFALAAAAIVAGFLYGPTPARADTIDAISSGALAAYLLATALLVIVSGHDALALAAFAALAGASVAIAWRAPSASAVVPVATALAALVMAAFAVETRFEDYLAPAGPLGDAVPPVSFAADGLHFALGFGFAALFGVTGYLAQGRSSRAVVPVIFAACAVAGPLTILAALYHRVAGFDPSVPFAGLALLLAAFYGIATENLSRRSPRPGLEIGTALFAVGCVAALALAFTLALEKGWLTVALAVMVPGIAWIETRRPLRMLRWIAAVVALLVLARIAWEPRIVGDAVGTTPIFNWLLYGYGVPALAFFAAGYLMRRRGDDTPVRIVDTLALLFTVLLASLEIRHLVNGGDIYRATSTLAEVGSQVSVWLALAIGLERLRLRTRSAVHDVGALVMAVLAGLGVVALLTIVNPMVTGDGVGGPIVNLVLLGYGIPAVLAATLALVARAQRPMMYRAAVAGVAVTMALAWISLEIRRVFHGAVLTAGQTSDLEQYTHSAAWLAFGVALLLVGIALGSQPARLASAAVTTVTIAKVFLYDMAGLTGIYRAASFLGLGLVLVGIGLLYQRLLFARRDPPVPTSAE